MSSSPDKSVDLICELQLRQWARRNYVAQELRPATWHPIVLSEMAHRDRERLETPSEWAHQRTPFVPLAPTDFTYFDDPHPGTPAPVGLTSPRDIAGMKVAVTSGDEEEDDERIAGY